MRQQKTGKKNRATYIYYDADGNKIAELIPGENGVTEALIAMLHQDDDEVFDAERREKYRTPLRYQGCCDADGVEIDDKNSILADPDADPFGILLRELDQVQQANAFSPVWNSLLPQQRELVLQKQQGRTNVEIAKGRGVSEAAVRNQLRKIQKRFEFIHQKGDSI